MWFFYTIVAEIVLGAYSVLFVRTTIGNIKTVWVVWSNGKHANFSLNPKTCSLRSVVLRASVCV